MALAKRYLFNEWQRELAVFGFVLSHPARITIVERLREVEVLSKPAIDQLLLLSPTTVSDHLRQLERAQLIEYGPIPEGGSGYRLKVDNYWYYKELLLDWLHQEDSARAA